jgi:hypothetical protein
MKSRDYQDLIGGALLLALGVFFVLYARRYNFGTLAQMGPGFFPTVLGVMLAILGALIALPAWKRKGSMPSVQWRTLLLVLAGVVLFAFTLRPLGLIVACLLTVIASSLADRETSWRLRLIIAIAVMLITVGIFKFGLGMTIPLWWGE